MISFFLYLNVLKCIFFIVLTIILNNGPFNEWQWRAIVIPAHSWFTLMMQLKFITRNTSGRGWDGWVAGVCGGVIVRACVRARATRQMQHAGWALCSDSGNYSPRAANARTRPITALNAWTWYGKRSCPTVFYWCFRSQYQHFTTQCLCCISGGITEEWFLRW